VVSGASKRGWTTWMVGAATCPDCPTVIGIAPLVPIVPDLNQIVHRQYQSLGGFTFAFKDYKEAGLFDIIDSPDFRTIEAISDPGNAVYAKRLARLPKYVIVSSDDEFMQLDWTPLWYVCRTCLACARRASSATAPPRDALTAQDDGHTPRPPPPPPPPRRPQV
jgi:PhoPQ-activated pathogenicity-related protein